MANKGFIRQEIRNCAYIKSRAWNGRWTLKLLPMAKVGHIGLYKSKTLEPVEYYCKLPEDVEEREIVILDPMLATGGSASLAIEYLKEKGVKA